MYWSIFLCISAASATIAGESREQKSVSIHGRIYRGHSAPLSPVRDAVVPNEERAAAVKEAFTHAWTGYKTYAFPNDELLPVSNTFGNSRQVSMALKL